MLEIFGAIILCDFRKGKLDESYCLCSTLLKTPLNVLDMFVRLDLLLAQYLVFHINFYFLDIINRNSVESEEKLYLHRTPMLSASRCDLVLSAIHHRYKVIE